MLAEQIDTTTVSGELVLNILMSVVQWERKAIGEWTRDQHRKSPGRPKGDELSMSITVRIPESLCSRLDRYLDRLESRHGLKANRGSVARRALERFLDDVDAEESKP